MRLQGIIEIKEDEAKYNITPKGRPIIQWRQCSEFEHFARDYQNKQDKVQLLCKWCRPRNHKDNGCLKQKASVNMIDVRHNEVLAIPCAQEGCVSEPTYKKRKAS